MKKNQREELAKECMEELKELGVQINLKGDWIELSPPSKLNAKLMIKISQCGDELTDIYKKTFVNM